MEQIKEESHRSVIKGLINSEIAGKNNAIHAYDRMVWTVRSGFLTLVFAGWSFVIKAAVENKTDFRQTTSYIFILSAFSLALAIGAYIIDRNYARRKFRVITGLHQLMEIITTLDFDKVQSETQSELTELLKISGDADNHKYKSAAYRNEITVSRIIYSVPSALITGIIFYYLFNN